jgi:hypothetical protein
MSAMRAGTVMAASLVTLNDQPFERLSDSRRATF